MVEDSFFEEGVIVVGSMTGSKGNQSFEFIIEYNINVSTASLGVEDIEIVGTGDADGKTIPITFNRGYLSGAKRIADYTFGPFDASANGTYSIRIVEGQVTGSGGAVPAGEIFSFNQDITWPTPEVLKVHPLEIMGEVVTGPTSPFTLEGTYGFAKAVLKIDVNKDTDVSSLWNATLEIVGTSGAADGKTLENRYFSRSDEGDFYTLTYNIGRFDATANGNYSIKVGENQIFSIGEKEEYKIALPAGEIAAFTQNITNPPPGIITLFENGLEPEYFPTTTFNQDQLIVYYNLAVDPASIDEKDLTITGISPDNEGETIKIQPGPRTSVDDGFLGQGYITAVYTLEDGLTEANNGDWRVEIAENEIFNKEDPPVAAAKQTIGMLKTSVIDEFMVQFKGRIYLEKEGTTPSLVDDGYLVDEGLPIGYGTIMESPTNGGAGYQDINFFASDIVLSDDLPLLLSHPITGAVIGDAGTGGFIVAGRQDSFFLGGHTIIVSGSSVNDGTFTVWSAGYDQFTDTTTVTVNEKVTSDLGEGTITKGAYKAEISIDGGEPVMLSFTADELQTVENLLDKVNSLLGDQAILFKLREDALRIESCSYGTESSILITEPEDGSGLFQSLGGNLSNAVAGNLDWEAVGGNNYIPPDEFEDEEDYGRLFMTTMQAGIHRVRVFFGEVQTKDSEGNIVREDVPPPPEYALQALGDPNREGAPKDHMMYFHLKRSQIGETVTVNFSYVDENDPPHIQYDEFQILTGTKNNRLNVLANDGLPAGNNEDLTIVGLSDFLGGTLLQRDPPPPTELLSGSQGLGNRIYTDGDYVYYDSPGPYYELIYYIIEDSQGRRDFEEIKIDNVFEITNQFAANDDFATMPITSGRVKINVLANDSVVGGGSREKLVITDITTPTAGGSVTYQGSDVFYSRPPEFLGIDTFVYTMTDGFSGTDTATVRISVNDSPVSEQRRALLNLFLKFFEASQASSAIFSFFKNHQSELNYIILDQGGDPVDFKASGNISRSKLRSGGTTETQARLNELLNLAEPVLVAVATGQGDSGTVSQELVDKLMNEVNYVQEQASPDLKADLEALCEMTNDFQDLVGKSFNESFVILGLEPDKISIPHIAVKSLNKAFSITTYDFVGAAFKLWKSSDLQPDSWEEIEDAEVEVEGQRATITDPNQGDEDAFYRVSAGVE